MEKIKLEVTKANNGYILGVVNPNFVPNSGKRAGWYTDTFVSNDPRELFDLFIAKLVSTRMEGFDD